MPRTTTALLALTTVVLTGCGPTTDDVLSMTTAGSAQTYENALQLRAELIDAGRHCPGTQQVPSPVDAQTTFLECVNGTTAIAVAGSEERHAELMEVLGGEEHAALLHGANWIVISRDEALLPPLQDEIGGTITANP